VRQICCRPRCRSPTAAATASTCLQRSTGRLCQTKSSVRNRGGVSLCALRIAAPDPKTMTYQTTVKPQIRCRLPPRRQLFPPGRVRPRYPQANRSGTRQAYRPDRLRRDQDRSQEGLHHRGTRRNRVSNIVGDKERAAFVRRFSGDKSTPTGDPTRARCYAPAVRSAHHSNMTRRRSRGPKRRLPSISARSPRSS